MQKLDQVIFIFNLHAAKYVCALEIVIALGKVDSVHLAHR